MTIINIIKLVLGLVSILLSFYSLLGFVRLSRFWFKISNLSRYQEIFLYFAVFMASFISALILVMIMAVN